ncbi:hypothetical protein B296_00034330 [Ensete ventricosum]|uniref:Uncharacterized protein n=1 Tax=Ensete ventricosum TaxID=4639 RepID=A0A426Z9H6_ENSVE|nr:hypothetical protein B296_00034330 [Ensete ventricosum]
MRPCCSPPHDTAPLRSTWGIRGGSSVSTLNHSLPSTHRSTRRLAQWPDSVLPPSLYISLSFPPTGFIPPALSAPREITVRAWDRDEREREKRGE